MSEGILYRYGLTERFAQEATLHEGLHLARVTAQHKDLYEAVSEQGEMKAEIAGRLGFAARHAADYPVVGDWVMVDRTDNGSGNAIISHILSRKSVFARRAAGTARQDQPVAANVDTVFICMALNNDYNLRRLERYLAMAWDSMATPVVVLTKADLRDDVAARLAEVHAVAVGTDVLVTSSMSGDGYAAVSRYVGPRRTVAFLGSSGVGKSTLINRLLGGEVLATRETRADDKGRHTTTRRQLIALPGGGVVIDTPGMRELQLEGADLGKAFADIEALAGGCRFGDCSHHGEPGCAVREAVGSGALSADRLGSYHKLQDELSYQGLNSRQLEQEKINRMFGGKGAMKQAMAAAREKSRRR